MTGDRNLAEFRQWALTVLDLLAAASDRQVEHLRQSNVGVDELLLQFDDVLHVARARLADGSIDGDDFRLLLKVNEKVDRVNARPDSFQSCGALEAVAEWRELRMAAGEVKATLQKSWNLTSRGQG